MTDLLIQPEELYKSAQDFIKASKDTQAIIKRLDQSTNGLEKKWTGVSQQLFFKQYQELRQYMQGFSELMKNISREMQAMAARFEKADK